MKTIHTTIVQDHLSNRPINKLLNRPPPDIDKKEETLPHSTRRKLSQLRTNKSPLLMTYLHKIDPANHPAANCPLCNDPNHDSLHLFNCPDIPTTLTVWDLWTDPVGVAALLDVWGEKLGGPRAGVWDPVRQPASWFKSETRLWSSSTQRPLGFVDPRYTHPPRRKEVIAHLSTLDCYIHDPTPRRRRGPPPKSRPNRNHPIPLRTPSPPPTLATYDRNFGDEQLPTLRGGRRVVWTSMAPMPCFHDGAWTPRPGEDLWWARAPPMRIASAAENHLQAPSVTPTTTTVRRTILSMTFRVLYWTEISQQWQTDSFMNRN